MYGTDFAVVDCWIDWREGDWAKNNDAKAGDKLQALDANVDSNVVSGNDYEG